MIKYWESMGITQEEFNDLKHKLKSTMKYSAEKTTRITHADEDGFFTKFMGRLGKIKFGNGYFLDFQDSKTTSKGKGSAEKKYGCDFGLRVDFGDDTKKTVFSKAIIGQAKNFPIGSLKGHKKENERLIRQCKSMANVTDNYIVTFRPLQDGNIPLIHLGNTETKLYSARGISFDEYILTQVLPCHHGEINKKIIDYMVSSTHAGWKEYIDIFSINTNLPRPNPELSKKPKPSYKPK